MSLTQLSDKLILPLLANKTPDQQREILLALRQESGLRAQVWIDQQLAKLEKIEQALELKASALKHPHLANYVKRLDIWIEQQLETK